MSLSAEEQKQITRKLKSWIENDRLIVTFREVSRELGCHVNLAKNILLAHAQANEALHVTYLLSGQLVASASIAQTQLPGDKPQLDAQTLAKIEASQRVKIVDMDVVSDGERNSEDGDLGEEEDEMGNDKGGEGGIAGDSDLKVKVNVEDEEVITPESTPRWGMILVAQDDFEEKKQLFDPEGFGCHVYALSMAPVKDPAQYLIPYTQLRQHPRYVNPGTYGSISGDLTQPGSSKASTGAGGAGMKDGAMDFGGAGPASKKKPDTSKAGVKQEQVVKKAEVKKEHAISVAKSAPATSASTLSIHQAVANPTKSSASVPAAAASSSSTARKPSQSKSRKRVVTSDNEDGDAEAEAGVHPPSDALAPPTSSDPAPEITSSMVRADDKAAMEAMMGMDMDDFDMDADEEDAASVAAAQAKMQTQAKAGAGAKAKPGSAEAGGEASTAKSNRAEAEVTVVKMEEGEQGGAGGSKAKSGGRKKRVVKKSRTEMDEKGYMVTKDYESEESYSGASDPEPSTTGTKAKTKAVKYRKSSTGGSGGKAGSRASSVSTDVGTAGVPAGDGRKGQSSNNAGSSSSIGASGAAGGKAKPPAKPAGAKPKGQSTLAGFFKKK